MTKAKKIAASIAAGLTLSAVSVTAYAASGEFDFHLPDHGGHEFSGHVKKTNTNDYAEVNIEGGHASSTAYAYLSVYKNLNFTGGEVTSPKLITNPSGYHKLSYKSGEGTEDSYYYLCFSVGYYGASLEGTWTP